MMILLSIELVGGVGKYGRLLIGYTLGTQMCPSTKQ